MRKINTRDFRVAKRSTSREVNRQIVLNIVRDHQPVSRADIARRMGVGRGVVTVLVNELLAEGAIYEGDKGKSARGRKPQYLYVRTRDRLVVAVDVRLTQTLLMLSDFAGREVALEAFPTPFSPDELVDEVAERIDGMLRAHGAQDSCEGIGLVVPGMVDRRVGRVLHSPSLGWREVDIGEQLTERTGLPVRVENSSIASALARMWLGSERREGVDDFAYVAVSDGIGVAIVINGEVVRGQGNTAGEFGHVPLSMDGPECRCGARGCWEAYAANPATLARYAGYDVMHADIREAVARHVSSVKLPELIERARAGEERALATLVETGRYLALGFSMVVNALNPSRIYVGGEITAGWDLVEKTVADTIRARALTERAGATPIIPDIGHPHPRLRGAAALLVAPTYAAPRVG